jgi:hypothetical protein
MTNTPTRIQQLRIRGWKMPAGARSVARPHPFGNPFRFRTRTALARVPAADLVTPWEYEGRCSADGAEHDMWWPGGEVTKHLVRYMTPEEVIATHRRALIAPTKSLALVARSAGNVYQVTVDLVRRELAGWNLACFCPPHRECHADTLLWVANAPEDEIKQAAEDEYEIIRAMAARVAALHPGVVVEPGGQRA